MKEASSIILESEENIINELKVPPLIYFDFAKSTPVLSPDNSFGIFYNETIMLFIDLKAKSIKSFQQFDNNIKIANVQINSNNQISYIKKFETHNEIIITSFDNVMDYNELKVRDNIIAYKLFRNNDYNDILLIINNRYEMFLYKDNLLIESSKRNLSFDLPKEIIKDIHNILNIEYLSEQGIILLFLDNGLILIYSLHQSNPENNYSNDEVMDYEYYIDLNEEKNKKVIYYNYFIKIKNYICDNNHHDNNENEKIEIDNNDDNNGEILTSSKKNPQVTTFLFFSVNQKTYNSIKSSIYFFKIENGRFTKINNNLIDEKPFNKVTFDDKEILDSFIFNYKIKDDENDMADYMFILLRQNKNNFNNNKHFYSVEYANLFDCFSLDKKKNGFQFHEIKSFEELPNTYIYINNINLTQKKRNIFTINLNCLYYSNINECRLGKKIITNENCNNINNNSNLCKSNINKSHNDYLSSDDFMENIKQMNSINFNEEDFYNDIISKYKMIYDIDLIIRENETQKMNLYLLNLIANQSVFKIKNYLMKRNPLNSSFVFPIEHICLTCESLLNSIKNKIRQNQNEDKNLNDISKLLNIIILIMKIIIKRNRIYNQKLFDNEKKILQEQELMINSLIFDTECLLFIIKIQALYYNDSKNKLINQNDYMEEKYRALYFKIFSFKEDINNNNVIIEDDNDSDDNFYNNLKRDIEGLHLKYLNLSEPLKKIILGDNSIDVNILLYYIKFIIFNYCFYYFYPREVKRTNNINIDIMEINNSNPLVKMQEFNSYFDISKTLFILDNNLDDKEMKPNIGHLSKFLQSISENNLIMNDNLDSVLHCKNTIYSTMNTLFKCHMLNEAFSVGNSLFSNLSSFDEFNLYLLIVLNLKDYPLAYSFVNNCLLMIYKDDDITDTKKLINSEKYNEIRNIYFNFFEYLIKNKAIDFLFKLPLNFIELYIFKDICDKNDQYKEFLIIYYIMIGNINEAKHCFEKYINLINVDSPSKILYANIIKYYEALFNKKTDKKDINEKIDQKIAQISKDKKFILEVEPSDEKIDIEGQNGKQMIDEENFGFSESLLQSSIMENKIISGNNINTNDYNKISTNLLNKLSNTCYKNLSSNYLSKENLKNKSKYNEVQPFSNNQLSSIHKNIINTNSVSGNKNIFTKSSK